MPHVTYGGCVAPLIGHRAAATGRSIERVIAVYEAGWSGFWLARWLMRHGVEVYVVQPSSVPVDRRIRRAKSDGIDRSCCFGHFSLGCEASRACARWCRFPTKPMRMQSATVLVREAFVRRFANGKALGSYAGLACSPYSSGGIDREQGIGKAGNRRVRTVMVELAWFYGRATSPAPLKSTGSANELHQQGGVFVKSWWGRWLENY